jgi:3',5'-cyclic AMP phosphodiesterase CpdA
MKRCLGLINWLRNRRKLHLNSVAAALAADMVVSAPDHIAVTGDLANLGLPGEFQTGLTWLATLGERSRVSLIPGNHDIYTTHCDTLCLDAWSHYMQSDTWGSTIAGPGFPYVRRVGPLALIALNSAVPTKLFRATGRIGPRQMSALAKVLEDLKSTGLSRVVLIHHPPLPEQAPRRRALEDGADLARVLAAHGADLVVHGHNHRDSLVWTPGPDNRRIPIVGVATGSAGRFHPDEPLARYNLYRFTGSPGELAIEIVTRGLARTGGSVVELGRRALKPDAAQAASVDETKQTYR